MGVDWVRPYSPGVGRWLVIGWEAIAFVLLGWASVGLFQVEGNGVTYLAMALTALWVVGGWRILEMGVYVGPTGLQIRGLLRSRRLSWDEIAHVRLHRHTNKIGRWEIEGGMTVLIERRDGSTVNTELWAQGVDFHNRPHLFREVYHDLRSRHLEAKAAGT
ncbi:PH domain-containing protein [Couchioplanes caeruleus]|uniref:PH domain-containing protein n=1 Tax=Couchioplanes caeruleus TaxID=56438 RepID=UPI0020BDAE82|nr:PH domain-containing protein [Couchioplanes caeruleus]UQU64650.1 PH domain-containing protein [Couchioplanes caeruleus]